MLCFLAVLRSFQERAKVTASVVDIDSDAHTVLFPATVSDRGGGNYEVRRQQGQQITTGGQLCHCARRHEDPKSGKGMITTRSLCNRRCRSSQRSRPPMGWRSC